MIKIGLVMQLKDCIAQATKKRFHKCMVVRKFIFFCKEE